MIGVEAPLPEQEPEVIWPELGVALRGIAPGVGVRVVLREMIGAVEVFPSLVLTGSVMVAEEAIARGGQTVAVATATSLVESMRKVADEALSSEEDRRQRERHARLRTISEVRDAISSVALGAWEHQAILRAIRELEIRA